MLPHASHDLIVLSDSDIRVAASLSRRCDRGPRRARGRAGHLPLSRRCRPQGSGRASPPTAINSHFLPNVLVGLKLGLAEPCFGSTIALRRETLARIGGFEAFADQLADDYAIGMAVRRLGLRVVIPPISSSATSATTGAFADLVRHELRAARTIRSIDPVGLCRARRDQSHCLLPSAAAALGRLRPRQPCAPLARACLKDDCFDTSRKAPWRRAGRGAPLAQPISRPLELCHLRGELLAGGSRSGEVIGSSFARMEHLRPS